MLIKDGTRLNCKSHVWHIRYSLTLGLWCNVWHWCYDVMSGIGIIRSSLTLGLWGSSYHWDWHPWHHDYLFITNITFVFSWTPDSCTPVSLCDYLWTYLNSCRQLWMGTHPKGPSVHAGKNIPLKDWLTTYPEFLGEKIRNTFPEKGELPFLFKVLSVGQSLSIQAHPDKVS